MRGGVVVCDIDEAPPEGTGQKVLGNVRGQITLTGTGRRVLAQGHLTVVVELECARCLKPHEVVLEIDVERECSLQQIDDPEAYVDEGEELPPVPIVNADEIDLGELVRQLIIIHTPPRSLCRPDCKGLCATCGADLNEGPCECESEIDPRLAPLRALLHGDE